MYRWRLSDENTLGYVGLDWATAQAEAGWASYVQLHEDKPPRVGAEGWQMSLPVITDLDRDDRD